MYFTGSLNCSLSGKKVLAWGMASIHSAALAASAAVRNDWFFLGGGFEVEVEFFFLSEERKKRRHRRCFLYLSLFLAFSRFLFSLLCRGRIRKR